MKNLKIITCGAVILIAILCLTVKFSTGQQTLPPGGDCGLTRLWLEDGMQCSVTCSCKGLYYVQPLEGCP